MAKNVFIPRCQMQNTRLFALGTDSDSSVGSSSYFKVLGKSETEKP